MQLKTFPDTVYLNIKITKFIEGEVLHMQSISGLDGIFNLEKKSISLLFSFLKIYK